MHLSGAWPAPRETPETGIMSSSERKLWKIKNYSKKLLKSLRGIQCNAAPLRDLANKTFVESNFRKRE